MALVNPAKSLLSFTGGDQYTVIETKIPWKAHHSKTCILGNSFLGHVFLKTPKSGVFYLGDASNLNPPVLLEHLVNKSKQKVKKIHTTEAVAVIMRRLQNKMDPIPDVQPLHKEELARVVIWSLLSSDLSIQKKWIYMEQVRIEKLLENYNIDNMKLIYPCVHSTSSYKDDIMHYYEKLNKISIPFPEIFSWVGDVILEYK